MFRCWEEKGWKTLDRDRKIPAGNFTQSVVVNYRKALIQLDLQTNVFGRGNRGIISHLVLVRLHKLRLFFLWKSNVLVCTLCIREV